MQRWPISEEDRAVVVGKLLEIVQDPKAKRREILAATRGLMAAERQNQSDEQSQAVLDAASDPPGNRFLAIAQRLGIDSDSERTPGLGAGEHPAAIAGEVVRREGERCGEEAEDSSGGLGGGDSSGGESEA